MAGMTPVTAAVFYGTRVKLDRALKRQRKLADGVRAQKRWSTEDLPRQEAALLRGDLRQHLAALREAGTLLDTVDTLAAWGIRAEMAARDWDREWLPVPVDAVEPGRWPGSRDLGTPERVPLRLPVGLVDQVRAACWWTSAQAIAQLRDWRDEHPDILLGTRPDEGPLLVYNTLAAQVTTTGAIWRAGLRHGILAADPESESADGTSGAADAGPTGPLAS